MIQYIVTKLGLSVHLWVSHTWLTSHAPVGGARSKCRTLTGLEANFFTNSQSFASGFNLNSQIAVSNSQLVSHF